jgi:hypothetical protein
MNNLRHIFCALASAMALTASAQDEAMPNFAIMPTPGYTPVYSNISGPVGWTFQPTTEISVTALGAFANLPLGLEIGLWNSSGALLASDTITSASTAVDLSLYQSITPVTLMADQTYYIAAYNPGGAFQTVVLGEGLNPPDGTALMSPYIQLGNAADANNGVFQFPNVVDGPTDTAIIGANFEFQPVPEPTTLALGGIGALALLAARRRR